jgi:ribosomal protein S18 acetylase RimI-like enzyme
MDPVIRNMTENDVPEVYRITCMSLDQHFEPEVFLFFMTQWPQGQIVACNMLGDVCGYICGTVGTDNSVDIKLFAVKEEYRNHGIGSILLNRMKVTSMMFRHSEIRLNVRDNNVKAIDFYVKNGFAKSEHIDDYYTDGGGSYVMVSSTYINS